ncbi:tRNA-specific adenosine deaminase [bacterium]|nr:tRNA-specific adenosine deaminase [bacterium]
MQSSQQQDEHFLRHVIHLAHEVQARNEGGPFACILVMDGEIIGTGWNRVTGDCDPTAHAEVVAIREACKSLGQFHLHGAVLYTSCEPCPMCLAAAYWAHVDRIVFAASRERAALSGFDDAFIYDQFAQEASQRSIPSMQMLEEEGEDPFDAWDKKRDKRRY